MIIPGYHHVDYNNFSPKAKAAYEQFDHAYTEYVGSNEGYGPAHAKVPLDMAYDLAPYIHAFADATEHTNPVFRGCTLQMTTDNKELRFEGRGMRVASC